MTLKIAIQKSGRLLEDSMRLFRECGIEFTGGVNRLRATACNFPLELLFLRDDDIPQYVSDSIADAGIVGENIMLEKNRDTWLAERLGFARCRFSIAIPRNQEFDGIQWLQHKKIATSYPNLLNGFLKKNNITCDIHEISGSVEIAPGIGLSDAIADLVSSGSTLFLNGLKETEVILNSEAVLIANKNIGEEKQQWLEQIRFRIRAVKKARKNKYIMLNAPDDKIENIERLLPGMKSPSVLPLAAKGWSSVHSVITEDDFWEVIGDLKRSGAEGILVLPIEKMIE